MNRTLGLGSTIAKNLKSLYYTSTNHEKTLVEVLMVNLKLIEYVKLPGE